MGDADGQVRLPPRGITAPKLDECKLFFNPVYRFIYIKNTKTAGSSVLAALNPCPQQATLEEVNMRVQPPPHLWAARISTACLSHSRVPAEVRVVAHQLGHHLLRAPAWTQTICQNVSEVILNVT